MIWNIFEWTSKRTVQIKQRPKRTATRTNVRSIRRYPTSRHDIKNRNDRRGRTSGVCLSRSTGRKLPSYALLIPLIVCSVTIQLHAGRRADIWTTTTTTPSNFLLFNQLSLSSSLKSFKIPTQARNVNISSRIGTNSDNHTKKSSTLSSSSSSTTPRYHPGLQQETFPTIIEQMQRVDISKLPQWMQEYISWHGRYKDVHVQNAKLAVQMDKQQQILKYWQRSSMEESNELPVGACNNATKSTYNVVTNNSTTSSMHVPTFDAKNEHDYRFLIVRCSEEDRKCGGTSDRLRSMPFFLKLAYLTERVLLIHWSKRRPYPLEEFLQPNIYLNWTVPYWMAAQLSPPGRGTRRRGSSSSSSHQRHQRDAGTSFSSSAVKRNINVNNHDDDKTINTTANHTVRNTIVSCSTIDHDQIHIPKLLLRKKKKADNVDEFIRLAFDWNIHIIDGHLQSHDGGRTGIQRLNTYVKTNHLHQNTNHGGSDNNGDNSNHNTDKQNKKDIDIEIDMIYKTYYHDMFRMLFRPSPAVATLIEYEMNISNLQPGNYSVAHYRSLYEYETKANIIEKNRNDDSKSTLPSFDEIYRRTINAIHCAYQLLPGRPIYFASDNPLANQIALSYAANISRGILSSTSTTSSNFTNTFGSDGLKVVTMTNPFSKNTTLHLDRASRSAMTTTRNVDVHSGGGPVETGLSSSGAQNHHHHPPLEAYYDTFVDLLIAGNGRCVTYGHGGFGRWANILSFDPDCGLDHIKNRNC